MLTGEDKKQYQKEYMKRRRSNTGSNTGSNKKDVIPVVPSKIKKLMSHKTFGYATKSVPGPAWLVQERRA